MSRLPLLTALLLACGDGDFPPEDCAPPLPPSNDDGDPWPTYAEASASLSSCPTTALVRRRGTCADGKTFLESASGYDGDTQYFDGETLVGLRRFTDAGFSCSEYRFGDVECDEASAEEITCP